MPRSLCARDQRSSYLRNIVELDKNLINLAISELAHYISVLVVGLFAIRIFLVAALFFLVVIVHEVIFVVKIIFADVDIAKGVCDRISR